MSTVEKWGWASVVGTLGAALGLGTLLWVRANGLDSGQNQAIAAWVQAVGSIGAILAAIWISNGQSREQRRDRYRERVERADSLLHLVERMKLIAEGRKAPLYTESIGLPEAYKRAESVRREAQIVADVLNSLASPGTVDIGIAMALYELRKCSVELGVALQKSDLVLSPKFESEGFADIVRTLEEVAQGIRMERKSAQSRVEALI